MASIAEMVEVEAALAEAEPDDEEEADEEEADEDEAELEPEPEPEQQTLAAIGPDEIKRAERAREGQKKRLAGILGDDYVAHECIFCSGLGFLPEPPPVGTVLTVATGEDGLTFEVQAAPSAIPLKHAPDKAECPECEGYGEVLSGSKAPHAMVTPCSKCSGNGWIMVARDTQLGPVVPEFPPAAPSVEAAGIVDAWGREAGHKHWGVPPNMIPG